jgi:TatA/E family protein of Tat protein translocase
MLSISHIIIIFIVALIVFGPEKLPELARNLGRVMADFRRASMSFRQVLDENMRQLEREVEESRAPASAPGPAAAPAALPAAEPASAAPETLAGVETSAAEPAAVSEGSKPAENPPDGNPSPA